MVHRENGKWKVENGKWKVRNTKEFITEAEKSQCIDLGIFNSIIDVRLHLKCKKQTNPLIRQDRNAFATAGSLCPSLLPRSVSSLRRVIGADLSSDVSSSPIPLPNSDCRLPAPDRRQMPLPLPLTHRVDLLG
jgi:hypothetical protein